MRHLLSPLVFSLLIASIASAQLTEKEATKQFSSEAKAAVSAFKNASKLVSDVEAVQIKAFQAIVKSGAVDSDDLIDLFEYLAAGQGLLMVAWDVALTAIATAGHEADLAMTPPPGGSTVFPKGFYSGDGGIADKARAELAKAAAKAAKKIDKTLRSTAKLLEKEAGIAFTYVLRPVQPLQAVDFGVAGVFESLGAGAANIDLVFAWSELGLLTDGRLHVAGSGGDELECVVVDSDGDGIAQGPDPDADGRWAVSFGSGWPEGNFIVSVSDGSDDEPATGPTVSIGLR